MAKMDPKNYLGDQHENWVVCHHCHQLYPSLEALSNHVHCVVQRTDKHILQEYRNTSLIFNNEQRNEESNSLIEDHLQPGRYFQQNHLKIGPNHHENQDNHEGLPNDANLNQEYRYYNHHNQLHNQPNDLSNAYHITENNYCPNYTHSNEYTQKNVTNCNERDYRNPHLRAVRYFHQKHLHTSLSTNDQPQNQETDLQARLLTGRYFQEIHLEVKLSTPNNLPQNQEKCSLKTQCATTNNLNQNYFKTTVNNNVNEMNPTVKLYLQTPYYPEDHDQTKNIAFEPEQTMNFKDPEELHKFEAVSDQNRHNNAIIMPASTARKTTENTIHTLPQVSEKIVSQSAEITETCEYEIRYKCSLCGADFGFKIEAMIHKTKHVNEMKFALKKKNSQTKSKHKKVIFQYKILKREIQEGNINETKDDNVMFVPQDSETTKILPRIVSISGSNGLLPNVHVNLPHLNPTNDNEHQEKNLDYTLIIEDDDNEKKDAETINTQDYELNENKEDSLTHETDKIDLNALQNLIDEYELSKRQENSSIVSNIAENKKQRKREERTDLRTLKKRSKLRLDNKYSNENDMSAIKISKKIVKAYLRQAKPKKKKDSDSSDEENSHINAFDTESDDVLQEINKYLKELINEGENMDLNKILHNKKDKRKRKYKEKIYKCKECSIHFMKEDKLRKHLKKGKHNDLKKRCVICRLKFSKKCIRKHIEKHHVNRNLKIKDFYIITKLSSSDSNDSDDTSFNNDNDTNHTSKLQNPESPTSNENQTEQYLKDIASKLFHNNTTEQSLMDNYQNEATSESLPVDDDVQPTKDESYNNKVYKCKSCDMCFLKYGTWKSHIFMDCNGYKLKTKTQCTLCDLNFTKKSCHKHMELHHNEKGDSIKLEIVTKDTIIINNKVFVETPQNISKLEYKTMEINKIKDKCTTSFMTEVIPRKPRIFRLKSYSNIIFKCRICKVNFLTLGAIKRHLYTNRHKITTAKSCAICGLSFCRIIIDRHLNFHHKTLKLKDKNDFQVITLPEMKNEAIKPKEEVPDDVNRLFEKVNDVINKDMEDETMNQVQLAFNQRERQDQSGLEAESTQQMKINSASVSIADVNGVDDRLYKCLRCDVHYIKEMTLIRHILAGEHNVKKCHPCPICHYTFNTFFLRKHISIQHHKLRIQKFNIMTSIQVYDGNQAFNQFSHVLNNDKNVKLKECVVQLTDIQSTFVSPTSKDVLNSKKQPQNT